MFNQSLPVIKFKELDDFTHEMFYENEINYL
jgi:hypothetical protein